VGASFSAITDLTCFFGDDFLFVGVKVLASTRTLLDVFFATEDFLLFFFTKSTDFRDVEFV
jgi:hypothetical protein